MGPSLQTLRQKLHDDRGFTLIEMAIVLIIIGIIMGAVVKGKDIVRSAEQKKLYSTFVREWQVAFNNYYDRTGWILADSNDPANAGTRDGQCNANATNTNIDSQLNAVGLTPPSAGNSLTTLMRTYTDSTGSQRTISLAFAYNATWGNHMRLTGMPNDLGIAIDRMVDGSSSGGTGDVMYASDFSNATTAAAWPSAATAPVTGSALILNLEF